MTEVQAVIRAVNRAEEVHFILDGMSRLGRSRPSGPAVDISPEPGAPIDLSMHDLASDLRAKFQGWAQLLSEEQGDPLPADEVTSHALFLRQHAIWIAGAEWAEVMIDELREDTRRGVGMLGMLPRRTKVPEPCECGADQWVYHEDVAFVRCADGHLASLADHAYSGEAETFTVSQVARMTGMARSTIGYMIDRGDLHAEGRPPMVPKAALHTLRGRLAS